MKEELEKFLDEMREEENTRIHEVIKLMSPEERNLYMNAYADAVVYTHRLLKERPEPRNPYRQ